MNRAIKKSHNERLNEALIEQSGKKLAENLRVLMGRSGLSSHELSRRTSVKQPVIHRLLSGENTNPTLVTLRLLAHYFKLTVSDLVGEEEMDSVWSGLTNAEHQGWMEVPFFDYPTSKKELSHRQKRVVVTEANVSDSAFAFLMPDDSMEPVIAMGAIVIVDPKVKPVNGQHIFIKTKTGFFVRNYLHIKAKRYVMPVNTKFGKIVPLLKSDEILGSVVRTIFDHGV